MQRFYTVVLEGHVAVFIIDGRRNQRIGYHHAPMRPAGVKAVVVIVVGAACFVHRAFFGFVQAVQRTAHVGSLQKLEHNRVDRFEMVETHFKSPQSVPAVLLTHGGEVVEVVAQICAD